VRDQPHHPRRARTHNPLSPEIGSFGQVLAGRCILLIKREATRHESEYSAGLYSIKRLGDEEIVQRQPPAAVIKSHISKRRIPDDGVDAPLRKLRVSEAFDANVLLGINGLGDAARDTI
jgi:hypothetical protein